MLVYICSIVFDTGSYLIALSKLAEKKIALEGDQEFETLFGAASVTSKFSLYTHVPGLLEACSHKEKPVDNKAISALLTSMYVAHLSYQHVSH